MEKTSNTERKVAMTKVETIANTASLQPMEQVPGLGRQGLLFHLNPKSKIQAKRKNKPPHTPLDS